jgi:cytochrome c oxidase subunit IV
MSSHSETLNHGHDEHTHEHGWKGYLYVLLILLVLTIITVGASRVDFGSSTANVVIAMTIATIKATLVALFFMHLKDDKPINGLIFVSTLLFLAVFLGFCMVDQDSRFDTRPATYKGPVDQTALPSLNVDAPAAPPAAAPAAAPAAGGHGAGDHGAAKH